MATEKYKLRTVRLEDDVWNAVKAMNCSLNQYLRSALLGSEPVVTDTIVSAEQPRQMIRSSVNGDMETPLIDNRPKNAYCKHCGNRFVGARFATICPDCKSSGHTLTPAECPACNDGRGI